MRKCDDSVIYLSINLLRRKGYRVFPEIVGTGFFVGNFLQNAL